MSGYTDYTRKCAVCGESGLITNGKVTMNPPRYVHNKCLAKDPTRHTPAPASSYKPDTSTDVVEAVCDIASGAFDAICEGD